jgi:NADH-quinone oxidoreductase subunit G
LADVVLPAQSWAEREGTFTSGERRVQRYYPAVQPVGTSRPDWQIIAQVSERAGLGKPAFAASLAFNEIAKAVPQYKEMNYRTLAQVVKQWPDVGGEDLYYGGNAYENKQGLGQQWATTAEAGDIDNFDVSVGEQKRIDGLQMIRTAALYTPGTLINHSAVLAHRLAQPTLTLHATDAQAQQLAEGDMVSVSMGRAMTQATVHINGAAPQGLALLSGVRHMPGTTVAKIYKQK